VGGAQLAALQAGKGEEAQRRLVYRVEALHEKLEEFSWPSEVGFLDTLAVTAPEVEEVERVDDDLRRETVFHNQALSCAQTALSQLRALKVPYRRPEDYYAEMVKSDAHMTKVKARLLTEKKQIEDKEERRNRVLQKKYGKQVQAEKLAQRARQKKADVDKVAQWRKQRQQQGFRGEAPALDLDGPGGGGSKRKREGGGGDVAARKKREFRDSKFGYGGRKRLAKQNDASSAADMRSYKPASFDNGARGKSGGGGKRGGKAGGGGGGGAAKQRPGKARRAAARTGGGR